MENHQYYLKRSLELAQQAAQKGESAVGCVVVKDGVIIGEGIEQSRSLKDVTRHAEVTAILDAVQNYGNCTGATLYTNVEPCILCSYVIRHHQISTVIFSNYCGELGGTSEHFPLLTTEKIEKWGAVPDLIFMPMD